MVEISRATAIINGNSGKRRRKNHEKVATALRQEAQARNVDLEVVITDSAKAAHAAIDASYKRGDQAQFIFGGDGTIKDAVNAMHRLRPQAGVNDFGTIFAVPYGSLNILGRMLGISSDVRHVFQAIEQGKIRRHLIDLGTVSIDGGPIEEFVSNAGSGPLVSEPFKLVDRTVNKRGGNLRHIFKLPETVLNARNLSGTITVIDGQEKRSMTAKRSSDLIIHNAGPIGFLKLTEGEKYNEGRLQAIVADGLSSRTPRFNTLATIAAALVGSIPFWRGRSTPVERRFTGKEVVIEGLQSPISVQVDGSYLKDAEEKVVFGIRPEALAVAAKTGRLSRRYLQGEGEEIRFAKPVSLSEESTPSSGRQISA